MAAGFRRSNDWVLQWGRVAKDAETAENPADRKPMTRASMGPRREGRGNADPQRDLAIWTAGLQWGRVAKDAETRRRLDLIRCT